jgi:hypothetical protein
LEVATVVGDQLVRSPPHTINKAHSHPDDRYAVVLKGTFYHGFGDKFGENKLEIRPVGTFSETRRMRELSYILLVLAHQRTTIQKNNFGSL